MNVVTMRNGKKMKGSSEKSEELKKSEQKPSTKDIVKEEENGEPYVAPPPYKTPITFLQRLVKKK